MQFGAHANLSIRKQGIAHFICVPLVRSFISQTPNHPFRVIGLGVEQRQHRDELGRILWSVWTHLEKVGAKVSSKTKSWKGAIRASRQNEDQLVSRWVYRGFTLGECFLCPDTNLKGL